ncbi:MAG TPA: zinc ribbon domain-containing protein [Deltaproteobacteria bacterium]|nr:zinc ribbon domain-containing protein [bacterium]RKY79499.1 MAG: zinc ribbon domain-containing protein [candidate division KSB1 bacterium]HDM78690.1 zinc ribbon domain-containing protein [Deltaproteobacteria bacterium]RKY81032.1 MAG: zinc ribbon domain-containing protein [candidate division KSB1 bacterium]RKY86691.1 MAG: zinc ribbon domain-containing protein [candidate division KSB1 bacterium]
MPIYEYQCEKCGNVMEVLVKPGVVDDEQLSCSMCGSSKMKKLLSTSAISMGETSDSAPSCCGIDNPCDNPKRCCGM